MNIYLKIVPSVLLILASTISLSACSAVPSKQAATKSGATLSQSYTWYDGDRAQTVWLNPQLLAEFNPSAQGAQATKAVDAKAKMVTHTQSQRGLRLWQVQTPTPTAVRSLSVSYPSGRYSPVFHSTASNTGEMLSLPGNIIVYLNPNWDTTAVNQWITRHQLELVKKLAIGTNVFVFKTAPGLEALNKANDLYQSGEVVAAFPDWWKEVATR
jgi:uncharacterized protein YceK